jgi:hypothetical protein
VYPEKRQTYLLPGFSEFGQKLTPINASHQGESTGVRVLKIDVYIFYLFINSVVIWSGASSKIDTHRACGVMGAGKIRVPGLFMTNRCTRALCDEESTVCRRKNDGNPPRIFLDSLTVIWSMS